MKANRLIVLPLLVVPFLASCGQSYGDMSQEAFVDAYNEKKDYSYYDGEIGIASYFTYHDETISTTINYAEERGVSNKSGYAFHTTLYETADGGERTTTSDYAVSREDDGKYYSTSNYENPVEITEDKALEEYNAMLDQFKEWTQVDVVTLLETEGATNFKFSFDSVTDSSEIVDVYNMSFEIQDGEYLHTHSWTFTTTFLVRQYYHWVQKPSEDNPSSYVTSGSYIRTFMYY